MWNSRERVIWFSPGFPSSSLRPPLRIERSRLQFPGHEFGLQLAYLEVFLGSLGGVLGLIYVLKKHHIPVRGLPD